MADKKKAETAEVTSEVTMTSEVAEIKKDVKELKEAVEKKPRKPREKVREIEEIINLPISKLTDKEKEKLIKALKEANTVANNKCEHLKQSTESAFAQARELEKKYDAMEQFYIRQLQYVDNQLNAFHAAVNQAIKGGIQ